MNVSNVTISQFGDFMWNMPVITLSHDITEFIKPPGPQPRWSAKIKTDNTTNGIINKKDKSKSKKIRNRLKNKIRRKK